MYHCIMDNVYTNYEEPIELMKKCTAASILFSFSFMREDGTRCTVRKARLRKGAKNDKNSKYKLQFTNEETGENKSCYIPRLLSFNNKLIDVSK